MPVPTGELNHAFRCGHDDVDDDDVDDDEDDEVAISPPALTRDDAGGRNWQRSLEPR